MTEIPLLLLTGLFILFIATNAKARDIARAYIKSETQRKQLVFLDDSIALKSMKIKRINGKTGFLRSYAFEFNASDYQRYQGKIELLSYRVISIQYFHPDHIEQSSNQYDQSE
ncbi:MAG: DUF3301 domain-containing protein [Alcanivoracaceae bacterium]|nr:DUF3301 domain-containing protein [Alcanivoracaceae bacterium]